MNDIGYSESQPIMKDGYPLYEWKSGGTIEYDETEEFSNEDDENNDNETIISIVDDSDDETEIENYEVSDDVRFEQENLDFVEENQQCDIIEDECPNNEAKVEEIEENIDNDQEIIDNDEEVELSDDDQKNEYELRRSTRINKGCGVNDYVQSFEGKSYVTEKRIQHTMVDVKKIVNQSQVYENLKHVAFTQMQAKVGIKNHGDIAIAAMFKELKQLDQGVVPELKNRVVCPIDPSTLTEYDKRKALYAVNVIKEKEMV